MTVESLILAFMKEHRFRGSVEDALKVAEVLFLYDMLLGNDPERTFIDEWAWSLVEDTIQWESYPWGELTFTYLIRYIRQIVVTPLVDERLSTYHFYGFSITLLAWAYEAIPALAEKYADRLSSNVVLRVRRYFLCKQHADLNDFFDIQLQCYETLTQAWRSGNMIMGWTLMLLFHHHLLMQRGDTICSHANHTQATRSPEEEAEDKATAQATYR